MHRECQPASPGGLDYKEDYKEGLTISNIICRFCNGLVRHFGYFWILNVTWSSIGESGIAYAVNVTFNHDCLKKAVRSKMQVSRSAAQFPHFFNRCMHDDRRRVANLSKRENHPPRKCSHMVTSNNLRCLRHETRAEKCHECAVDRKCSEPKEIKLREEKGQSTGLMEAGHWIIG